MVKWCAVRNCQSGSKTEAKCSMFRVPKDTVMWKKWEETIPGIVKLNRTDVVCEKHFDDNDISRKWVKLDANGQIIAQATYKRPSLKDFAVPTKFADVASGKENFLLFHEYAKPFPISHRVPANDNSANSSRNSPSISPQSNISGESSSFTKPSMQVISTAIDIACIGSPTAGIGMSLVPMGVSSCKSPLIDSLECYKPLEVPSSLNSNEHIACADSPALDIGKFFPSMVVSTSEHVVTDSLPHHEIFEAPSSPNISERTSQQNESTSAQFSAYVPKSWSVGQSRTENGKYTYFSYSISKMGNTDPCPVIQKCITLDAHGTLKYFVYGRRVDLRETEVERVFEKKDMLLNVLKKFESMGVCSGLGNIHIHHLAPGEAYQDCVEKWRSKNCSLLSKKKRCDSCARSRRYMEQRTSRLRNQGTIKRVGRVSNLVDRRKLLVMQNKIRREMFKKMRGKDRVKHRTTCVTSL